MCPAAPSAYMLQEVLESRAATAGSIRRRAPCPGTAHRPAYGSDGDYWSKPNPDSVFNAAYEILREARPAAFPSLED